MAGKRKRGGGGDHGGGEERWLLPYADMITLLLGLFIVLFAMSSVDAKKFDNVKRSLSQTFDGAVLQESGGVLPGSTDVLDPTAAADSPAVEVLQTGEATRRTDAQFDKAEKSIEQVAKQTNLGNDVKVTRNEIGIKVSLAGDALFASGEYELRPGVIDALTTIERELQQFNRPIDIAGHTDGAPMEGMSNYQLASLRAEAVRTLFLRLNYPAKRMHTSSHGPDEPALEPPSKYASVRQNRRIEITVLEPGAFDTVDNDAAEVAAAKPKSSEHAEVDRQLTAEFANAGSPDLIGELASAASDGR